MSLLYQPEGDTCPTAATYVLSCWRVGRSPRPSFLPHLPFPAPSIAGSPLLAGALPPSPGMLGTTSLVPCAMLLPCRMPTSLALLLPRETGGSGKGLTPSGHTVEPLSLFGSTPPLLSRRSEHHCSWINNTYHCSRLWSRAQVASLVSAAPRIG